MLKQAIQARKRLNIKKEKGEVKETNSYVFREVSIKVTKKKTGVPPRVLKWARSSRVKPYGPTWTQGGKEGR